MTQYCAWAIELLDRPWTGLSRLWQRGPGRCTPE